MVGAGVSGVGVLSCPVVVVFVLWWLGPFFLVDDDVPRSCFFVVVADSVSPIRVPGKSVVFFFLPGTGDLYFLWY